MRHCPNAPALGPKQGDQFYRMPTRDGSTLADRLGCRLTEAGLALSAPRPPLVAALGVGSGRVTGDSRPRPRAWKFRRILRRIDRQVPKSREGHLVPDTYATHKTPEVTALPH